MGYSRIEEYMCSLPQTEKQLNGFIDTIPTARKGKSTKEIEKKLSKFHQVLFQFILASNAGY